MASADLLYDQRPFFVSDADFSRNRLRFFPEDRVFDLGCYVESGADDDEPLPAEPVAQSTPGVLNVIIGLAGVAAGSLVALILAG